MEQEAKAVTEEDLLKSLEKLEGKKEEKKEVVTEVKTEKIQKSALESLKENDELKKSMEVSPFLKSFAEEMGLHVDESIATLQKSIQEAAKRDLAVVRVLETLQKSVDALAEEVKKYGTAPAAGLKSRTTEEAGKVIQKTGEGKQPEKPSRKTLLFGLEKLAKTAKPGTADFQKYAGAVVKFESTNQISDEMIREALLAANEK